MNTRIALVALILSASSCLDLEVPTARVGAVQGTLRSKTGPVAAATVTLTPESGASVTTTTASTGAFTVTSLSAGLWSLSVSVPGFLPLEKTFSIANGQTRELGELTLYSEAVDLEVAGTLKGTVHVEGADGQLVQGGTVEALIQPSMNLVSTTALGAAGLFALQVPPGTYSVRASHPSFVTAVIADITVASRAETALADDALVMALNPGRVSGRVLKEVDGAMAAVPAGDVTIFSDTGASTITASDGTFSLGGLPGGSRVLTFSATGLHSRTGPTTVQVVPGMTTALGDVSLLLDRGDVVGLVEMGDASALRDVTVFLDGTSYSAQAVPSLSDPAKGSFRIAQVPVGVYTLTAARTGYRSVSSGTFTVRANEPVTVPALAKLTRIQGDFVIDDSDQTNTPGFTRTPQVQLLVNNPTQVAEWRAGETDPAAANLPFQPFGADGGSGIAFTLSATEGEKTVFLQLRDNLGALGPVLTASVVLDSTPPTDVALSLAGGAAFTSQANPMPFSLTGNDAAGAGATSSGLAFMRLSLSAVVDGSGSLSGSRLAYRRDDSFTRPTADEGSVTLYAQLIDNAGNVSPASSASVVVDVTAPTGALSILRGTAATKDGYTNSPLVVLQVAANGEPNGGSVRLRLANALADLDTATPVPVASGVAWFLDASSDGVKTISYRFIDSAGNLSAPLSATIVLDTAAPTPLLPAIRLASLNSGNPSNSLNGSLTATVMDDRELSPNAAVLLDVAGTATQLPPTSPTTVTGSLPFTLPLSEGVHAIRVAFKDAAGNVSVTTEFSVELDQQPPAGSIALTGALADGTPSSSITSATSVKVTVTQLGAKGVLLSTNPLASCPVAQSSYLSLFDPSLLNYPLGASSGTVTVSACIRDAAGNTALLTPVVIAVDVTAPTGCALQLSGTRVDGAAAPSGLSASASVAASAPGCSEAPTEVYVIETGTPVSCTNAGSYSWRPFATLSPLALTPAEGTKSVRGCVRDAARNVGSLAAASMTLDTSAPTGASVVINGDAPYLNASQISGGAFNLSLTGSASGATEWAVDVAPGATNFVAFPADNPRAFSMPVGVDGIARVFARFRDALGNQTYVADSIVVDTVAPSAPVPTITPTGDVGFVNSQVITVQFSALAGAASMVVAASRVSAAACTTALGSSTSQPPLAALTMVLSANEGTHFVCVQSSDAAGNVSSVSTSSAVLDLTPPTRPVITTNDGYASLAAGQTATVDIATASTDTNFKGYQRLGGTAASWVGVTPIGTRFALPVQNDGSEEGYRNELRLRAVDQAGNVSAESSVLITADTNPPEPAIVDRRWVDNSNLRSTVYWQRPDAGDIQEYEVYYNASPITPLNGAYANEGVSPIHVQAVGATMSATLSGLANGSSTFVQVIPVDRAGNRASLDAGVLQLQSNLISPNLIATLTLPVTHAWVDHYADGYLYVAGSTHPTTLFGFSCFIPGEISLLTYDVRRLVAPVQGGTINSVVSPPLTNTATYSPGFSCTAAAENMSLRVVPPHLFFAAHNQVRIYDISDPSTPVLRSTLTLPSNARGPVIEVLGDSLFISVGGSSSPPGFTYSVKLTTLFDDNAATIPNAFDNGVIDAGVFSMPLAFITRDVLVHADTNSFSPWLAVRLTDALDPLAAGTTWNLSDVMWKTAYPQLGGLVPRSSPQVSGNYLYFIASGPILQILPLAPIWSGTVPVNSGVLTLGGIAPGASFTVTGDQLLSPDSTSGEFRLYDISDFSVTPPSQTTFGVGAGNIARVISFGSFASLLSTTATGYATASPVISIVELATPRGLTSESVLTIGSSGGRPDVRAGFVISPGRPGVYDLHAGSTPASVGDGAFNTCYTGSAHFDDLEVQAYGTNLRVIDFESMLDRNPATLMFPPANCGAPPSVDYCVAHPLGAMIQDVAAWGNFLVVAETRNRQELWVEVFSALPLRDRLASTSLSLSSPILSLQVYVAPGQDPTRSASINMTQGYAVLTLQENVSYGGGRVFVVDLRAAFDDAPTTVTAASIQAAFAMPAGPDGGLTLPRMATLSADTLYIASTRGVWAVPAGAVTDSNPLTVADGTGATNVFPGYAFDDLQVAGSTVIAAPGMFNNQGQQQALVSFDTSSSPTILKPIGFLSLNGANPATCNPPTDPFGNKKQRSGLTIVGSKAYFQPPTVPARLHIIQLE